MEKLIQDLRYAIRMLAKNKSFALVVVLLLALGIGANTTIFTLLNAIFLQPLPVEKPNELVSVFTIDKKNSTSTRNFLPVSFPNYEDYQKQNKTFSGLLVFSNTTLSLTGKDEPKRINGLIVSGNYFDVLGVKAVLGRTFLPEEDKTPGTHPVIVLGNNFWKTQFGASPQIIGSQLTLNSISYTVIGVAPENFRGTFAFGRSDFFVPMMMHDQVLTSNLKIWFNSRRALLFSIVGRLNPSVTIEQAQAELKTIASQLEVEYPKDNENRTISLVPLTQSSIDPNQRNNFIMAGILLMGIVGLVLLIACANIANLLLARANVRRREVAIRLALGASKWRLFQQFLVESILLSLMGGVAGLILAFWGRDLLWSYRPAFLENGDINLSIDFNVLGFTLVISLVTGIIFGIVPTFQATKPTLVTELKEKSSQTTFSNRLFTLQNMLIVFQIAFSLISLISASLFLRSLISAQQINLGFEDKKLLTMSFNVGSQNYDETKGKDFYRRVQEKVEALPGVKVTSLASNSPLAGGFLRSVFPEGGDPEVLGKGILTITNNVGLKYFETLNIPMLQGRDFTEIDRETSPSVCIINKAMAKRFWPGQQALGKRFKFFGNEEFTEVVGIVEDSKQISIGEEPTSCVYLPLFQVYSSGVTLHVQSLGDPKSVLATVKQEIQALDPNLPIIDVHTISETIDQTLWAPYMSAWLLSLFGLLALALAAVGIYGILACSVIQRTQEIGIRMALGARPIDIFTLILRQAMILVIVGIGTGLLAGFFVARLFSNLLFSENIIDPATFLVTPLILLVVAFIASYLPAHRATKVDPLVALRQE